MQNGQSSKRPYPAISPHQNVGECIYCGRKDDLTDEHIIPYALNGNRTLNNASCKSCAQLTSDFERIVLRSHFLNVRTIMKMQSRKTDWPDAVPLTINDEEKSVSTSVAPGLANFILYELPGALTGKYPEDGINIIGSQLHQIGNKKEIEEMMRAMGAKKLTFSQVYRGNEFERLIAKIAYGFAIWFHGIDAVRSSPLKKLILGEDKRIGRLIGTGLFYPPERAELHYVRMERYDDWLIARVRLFAMARTPEYIIVILEGDSKSSPTIEHGGMQPINQKSRIDISAKVDVDQSDSNE